MHKSQGFTLIALLMVVIVVGVLGVLAIRVMPALIQHYEVQRSLKSLSTLDRSNFSDDPAANAAVLKKKLLNQLYINGLENIKEDQITVTPNAGGKYLVLLKYTAIKPLFANVSLLFDYNESQEVIINAE